MTKPTRLTDDELGDLLRETFADHETLPDHLPRATKRRNPAPVLLAAAAVLAVVVGVLYGVHRSGQHDPAQPVATAAVTDDGDIWGAAIVTLAGRFAPPEGWQSIQVDGAGDRPMPRPHDATQPPAVTFSAVAKTRIEQAVAPLAPVQWASPVAVQSCNRHVPSVTVGPIVDRGDHKEVAVSISYDCGLRGYLPTYRIEKVDGAWKVTGTIGTTTGVAPAAGCPRTAQSSASPREGC
jgi:hypothetical protein